MIDGADITRHGEALRALARAMLRDEHEAEEVVQDAWLAAVRSDAEPQRLLPWLRGAVRKLSFTRRRDTMRRRQDLRRLDAPEPSRPEDETAVQAETAAALAQALHDLPDDYRRVVVMRYWQDLAPRTIADELGLPIKTVRNRLHRGLVKLRERLEGERHDVLPALALLAAPRGGSEAAGLAAAAIAAPSAGKVAAALAFVAAGCLLSLAAWWALADPSRAAGREVADSAGSIDVDREAAPAEVARPATVVGSPDEPTRAALEVESHGGGSAVAAGNERLAADAGSRPPGLLRMAVIDASTGQQMERVTFRTVSDERFAQRRIRYAVELPLSPGLYEALLLKPGFDPLEVAPFTIASGKTTDLGSLALQRGTARLSGRVALPPAMTTAHLDVELFGPGRGPCTQCSGEREVAADERCGTCGYRTDSSLVRIEPSEVFAFGTLAAGEYYVVVRDAGGVVLLVEQVKLDVGEDRWIELEARFVDLDLRIVGADGQPFDGNWTEKGKRYGDALRFYFWDDQVCCAGTEIEPWDPHWGQGLEAGREVPNPFEAANEALARELAGTGAAQEMEILDEEAERAALDRARAQEAAELAGATAIVQAVAPDRVDAVRRPGDDLWPPLLSAPPNVQTRPLSVTRLRPGDYRLRNVPLDSDTVLVSCGPYFSQHTALDLAGWNGEPIEIRIERRCGMDSEVIGKMEGVRCTSCHALPDLVW